MGQEEKKTTALADGLEVGKEKALATIAAYDEHMAASKREQQLAQGALRELIRELCEAFRGKEKTAKGAEYFQITSNIGWSRTYDELDDDRPLRRYVWLKHVAEDVVRVAEWGYNEFEMSIDNRGDYGERLVINAWLHYGDEWDDFTACVPLELVGKTSEEIDAVYKEALADALRHLEKIEALKQEAAQEADYNLYLTLKERYEGTDATGDGDD